MTSLDNAFHGLHQNGLLVLANVADAGGARMVECLGGKAVATSHAAGEDRWPTLYRCPPCPRRFARRFRQPDVDVCHR